MRRVREVTGSERLLLVKARGYGLEIHGLYEALDTRDTIEFAFDDLDRLTDGTTEWFYDFEARIPGNEICFGLHDSTALFVEAPREIAEAIAGSFASSRAAT